MTYELHNGDCLDILPTLPAQSIDAVICDPPYGTTSCKWDSVIPFEPMWRELKRVIKPRGAIVLFGSQPFTSALVMSNPKMFRHEWVWKKGRGFDPQLAKKRPMQEHETISVFGDLSVLYYPQKRPLATPDDRSHRQYKDANRKDGTGLNIITSGKLKNIIYTDRYPTSVLLFAPVPQAKRRHPSEKPLDLIEYLVRTYTNEGDTVLDFAMGSGTTGHACGNLSRRFVGIEKDAGYFAAASERIAAAYAPLAHMEIAT